MKDTRRGAQASHAVAEFMNRFPGQYKNTRLVQLVSPGYDFQSNLARIGKLASLGIWAEPDEGYVVTSYAFLARNKCKLISQYRLI